MIDCREAVSRMWGHLERSLEPVSEHELETHLETCLRCCGELEFTKELRSRVEAGQPTAAIPPAPKARIERLLSSGRADADGQP